METEDGTILYHFTNQQGLLGIVENKEIWATQIQYLNDTSEYRYTLELAQRELEENLHKAVQEDDWLSARTRTWTGRSHQSDGYWKAKESSLLRELTKS